jgi:hypothetical protein
MTHTQTLIRIAATALGALALAAASAVPADAAMRSERISHRLCLTTGGGRFVDIPHFPGEKADRRILRDIRWMRRKFDIFITDGYSTAPYHSRNGEHPIGLALDIVPDGHGWRKISRLAKKAEPRQNQPKMPWRWVGYNGDANHGRGDHLHLSYAHSDTRFNDPAKSVYTRLCPDGTKMVKAGTLSTKAGPGEIAPVVAERR